MKNITEEEFRKMFPKDVLREKLLSGEVSRCYTIIKGNLVKENWTIGEYFMTREVEMVNPEKHAHLYKCDK